MDTRRSFVGKLLSALGLTAFFGKIFAKETPSAKPLPDQTDGIWATSANSDVVEFPKMVFNSAEYYEYPSASGMAQMDWLAQASGRPAGAKPWANERIIPRGYPYRMKSPRMNKVNFHYEADADAA